MTVATWAQGDFDRERSWVRDQTYGNARVEKQAARDVDKKVFDQVRVHERALVRDGQGEVAAAQQAIAVTDQVASQLQSEITDWLTKAGWTEEPVNIAEAVARYNALYAQVEPALGAIVTRYSRLVWIGEKLRDPYRDLSNLLMKFFGKGRDAIAPGSVQPLTFDASGRVNGGNAAPGPAPVQQ